jgi:tripeptidyl-peptidase-1
VNPVLYAHPEVLNDITNGTNVGCGTEGFHAVKGYVHFPLCSGYETDECRWDPATGLGTPNYPKMLKLFLELP